MKYSKIFFLLFFIGSFCGHAQDLSLYKKEVLVKGKDTLPYRFLLPQNFDATKTYPIVIFLHGSGERGNDNEAQLIHGGKLFLKQEYREKYPAIVVFPQCPKGDTWHTGRSKKTVEGRIIEFPLNVRATKPLKMVSLLLKKVKKTYKINTDQIYLGGLSMGGMGVFELVRRKPKTFAAAFSICGAGNPLSGRKLKNTSWWIFHGEDDTVVSANFSKDMVAALEKENAKVKSSFFAKVGHDSWHNAFAEPELLTWLFSEKK